MTLVTILSAPKAFGDRTVSIAQQNAIGSWKRLEGVAVVLLGDDDGIAVAARDLGVGHIPGVAVNRNGVPLISSMLRLGHAANNSPLLGIVNADVILTSEFTKAVRQVAELGVNRVNLSEFLLVSRRWDMELDRPLEYTEGWEDRLRTAAHHMGSLHRPTGSDMFVFPRDCYQDMPDFAIGRAGWDNWMIYKARKEGWPVIDCTPSMLVVHQNHDYRHLPGSRPHYNHPDTEVNTRLAGGKAATRYSIVDATHVLKGGRLKSPPIGRERVARGVELFLRRSLFFLPENLRERVVRPVSWGRRRGKHRGRADS
jgi:hypothetical protein